MPNEPLALARRAEPASPGEAEYSSFHATLSTTERGRWFLGEHARRARNADSKALLAALDRIEDIVRGKKPAVERLRGELRVLVDTIRLATPDIEHTESVSLKNAKLGALVKLLERRIEAMLGESAQDEQGGADDDAELFADTVAAAPPEADPRAHLTVVPPPEQPELPIPSAANDQAPPIALIAPTKETGTPQITLDPVRAVTHLIPVTVPDELWPQTSSLTAPARGSEAATLIGIEPELHAAEFVMPSAIAEPEPDVSWSLPASGTIEPDQMYVPYEVEPIERAEIIDWSVSAAEAAPVLANPVASDQPPAPSRPDPLAPLRALSEEEIIALFT